MLGIVALILKLAALADKGIEELAGKLNKDALSGNNDVPIDEDNAKALLNKPELKRGKLLLLNAKALLAKGNEDKVESRLGIKELVPRLDNTALLDKGKLLKGKEVALNANGIALLIDGKLLDNEDNAGGSKELLNNPLEVAKADDDSSKGNVESASALNGKLLEGKLKLLKLKLEAKVSKEVDKELLLKALEIKGQPLELNSNPLKDAGSELKAGKLNKDALNGNNDVPIDEDNAKALLNKPELKRGKLLLLNAKALLAKGNEDKVESRLGIKELVPRLDNTALLDKGKLLKGKEVALNANGIALLIDGKLLDNEDNAGGSKELLNNPLEVAKADDDSSKGNVESASTLNGKLLEVKPKELDANKAADNKVELPKLEAKAALLARGKAKELDSKALLAKGKDHNGILLSKEELKDKLEALKAKGKKLKLENKAGILLAKALLVNKAVLKARLIVKLKDNGILEIDSKLTDKELKAPKLEGRVNKLKGTKLLLKPKELNHKALSLKLELSAKLANGIEESVKDKELELKAAIALVKSPVKALLLNPAKDIKAPEVNKLLVIALLLKAAPIKGKLELNSPMTLLLSPNELKPGIKDELNKKDALLLLKGALKDKLSKDNKDNSEVELKNNALDDKSGITLLLKLKELSTSGVDSDEDSTDDTALDKAESGNNEVNRLLDKALA